MDRAGSVDHGAGISPGRHLAGADRVEVASHVLADIGAKPIACGGLGARAGLRHQESAECLRLGEPTHKLDAVDDRGEVCLFRIREKPELDVERVPRIWRLQPDTPGGRRLHHVGAQLDPPLAARTIVPLPTIRRSAC